MNNLLSEKDTKTVLDILVEEHGVARTQLTPDARFQDDLSADSLTLIEIAMAIEERFNLAIPDEEWERVQTVQDLFEELANLLGSPGRPRLA